MGAIISERGQALIELLLFSLFFIGFVFAAVNCAEFAVKSQSAHRFKTQLKGNPRVHDPLRFDP